jgi:hypothetical protein
MVKDKKSRAEAWHRKKGKKISEALHRHWVRAAHRAAWHVCVKAVSRFPHG